jgi:hypothetical protein
MIDQDDHGVYDKVAAAFEGVHLADEPGRAVSRGRALRRRRRALPAVAVTGILAASLSLAAVTQTDSGGRGGKTGAFVMNVDNAAFSVHTDAKTGLVTVTFRQLNDPSELQTLLQQAGVPISLMVEPFSTSAPVCTWTGATVVTSRAVSDPAQAGDSMGGTAALTFDPARLPRNGVIGVLYFEQDEQVVGMHLAVLSNRPTGCVTPRFVDPNYTPPRPSASISRR